VRSQRNMSLHSYVRLKRLMAAREKLELGISVSEPTDCFVPNSVMIPSAVSEARHGSR
jgi:hypothetical protein